MSNRDIRRPRTVLSASSCAPSSPQARRSTATSGERISGEEKRQCVHDNVHTWLVTHDQQTAWTYHNGVDVNLISLVHALLTLSTRGDILGQFQVELPDHKLAADPINRVRPRQQV